MEEDGSEPLGQFAYKKQRKKTSYISKPLICFDILCGYIMSGPMNRHSIVPGLTQT